jgi:hypothetical protein
VIRFPRRLNLGFRPWYGLTLRQLAYLLFAAMFGGLLVLTGPTKGVEFIIRIVAGLLLIGAGVALAFFRFNGMTLERWIIARIRFLFKPQLRVWNRGEGRRIDANADLRYGDEPAAPAPTPQPVVTAAPAPKAAAGSKPLVIDLPKEAIVIFADLVMVLALLTLTVWLKNEGWSDLQLWYISVSSR